MTRMTRMTRIILNMIIPQLPVYNKLSTFHYIKIFFQDHDIHTRRISFYVNLKFFLPILDSNQLNFPAKDIINDQCQIPVKSSIVLVQSSMNYSAGRIRPNLHASPLPRFPASRLLLLNSHNQPAIIRHNRIRNDLVRAKAVVTQRDVCKRCLARDPGLT